MRVFLLCLLGALAIASVTCQQNPTSLFQQFKRQYGRVYANATEEQLRFTIFQQNLAQASALNSSNPNALFGVTQFMDLNDTEFTRFLSGNVDDKGVVGILPSKRRVENNQLPTFFDWHRNGVCTPVKNQGQCASGWAYAATAAVECFLGVHHGKNVSLSVQQIVNCALPPGANGCAGGNPNYALNYVHQIGLVEEAVYPYYAQVGYCNFSQSALRHKIPTWRAVTPHESHLYEVIYGHGPIVASLDATILKTYQQGIIENNCTTGRGNNHAVVITGWGATAQGVPYWNVRNSWGTTWGEYGFVRIARNNNNCGIANQPRAVG